MNIIFFVDEIQMSDETANPYNPAGKKITFYDALNDLRSLPNLDVYVTGSNSKMLSSDILTEFRGPQRRDPRPPASVFRNFCPPPAAAGTRPSSGTRFTGGMPFVLSRPNEAAKMNYLKSLFSEVYLKDIVERKKNRARGRARHDSRPSLFLGRLADESRQDYRLAEIALARQRFSEHGKGRTYRIWRTRFFSPRASDTT